jgi:GAF domain-containing protein/HAMP domain-containing protein
MTTSNKVPKSGIRSQVNKAYRISLIAAIFHAIITAILIIFGLRIAQQMIIAVGIAFLITIMAIVSTILNRRGRSDLGIWMLIVTIIVAVPTLSLLTVDFGWFNLISIPLVVSWIASQCLKPQYLPRVILLGILSGVASLLLDLYGSPERLSMNWASTVLPILIGVLVVIAAGLIIRRQFEKLTFRTKLLVFILIVALVPLTILAYFNGRVSQQRLTDAANRDLLYAAEQTAIQYDEIFTKYITSLEAAAQLSDITHLLSLPDYGRTFETVNRAEAALSIIHSQDPDNIISFDVLDRDGILVASYPTRNIQPPPFLGFDSATEQSLKTLLLTGLPYISSVSYDPIPQLSSIYIAARITSAAGYSPTGIILARYNASFLQDVMVSSNGQGGEDSFGVLLDNKHIYLAHGLTKAALFRPIAPISSEIAADLQSNGRLLDLPIEDLSINDIELEQALSTSLDEPYFVINGLIGENRRNQGAVARLDTVPWSVSFFQPQDIFLAEIEQQTRNTVLLSIIIAAIVAISGFGAAEVLTAPIVNLTELVERISKGDLSIHVPVTTRDEIGTLASTFNNMTSQIRNLLGGLEKQVADRTQELDRRARQLQAAAEVARDASSVRNLEELLNHAVDLISDYFGYYHAGIFMIDEHGEYALLQAANSDGGKIMLTQGHKLKVGEEGIVGYVAEKGSARIALDVGVDAIHFQNPNLPETRSEIGLPLKIGSNVIGVLDVQSKQEAAFDENDITVLQILADQLSIAIQNARLLQDMESALREAEIASGGYTKEAWFEYVHGTDQVPGYRYRKLDIEPVTEQPSEVILAWETNQPVKNISKINSGNGDRDSQSTLAVPIKLRDQTLGVINLRFEGSEIPADADATISAIADRLGMAMDNARLLQQAQLLAQREQQVNIISTQLQKAASLDAILQGTVRELGRALGASRSFIQIGLPISDDSEDDAVKEPEPEASNE